MKDDSKTKAQLIEELTELRQHVAELEAPLSPQMGAEPPSVEQTVPHVELSDPDDQCQQGMERRVASGNG